MREIWVFNEEDQEISQNNLSELILIQKPILKPAEPRKESENPNSECVEAVW